FVAASIAIPDLIMRALFARGAFTNADAAAAAATLSAYAIGLVPFMWMRSFTAPFLARGDTATPVKAALLAALVNIVLKIVLMTPLAQVGLALATAAGGWLNWLLLVWFARAQGFARPEAPLDRTLRLVGIGIFLGLAFYAGQRFGAPMVLGIPRLREEI